jgi:putative ABC transport system ATP-binding protein
MAIIEFKNICKSYGKKQIFKDLSFEIEDGEMVAIIGESGSGKSTILNIIGLLETIDSGKYILDGEENIKINSGRATIALRKNINYLFQNFALIEEESVYSNLEIALKYTKKSKKEKLDSIKNALIEVGLKDYENRKIYELSGGEQQRVAIARCILKPSKIILADEPTGSLDKNNVLIVLDLLKKLNKKGQTVIIVTHDPFVAESCTRIINLNQLNNS